MNLKEKVAIVTGGGSGMGRATAQSLVRKGARVAVADLHETAARETAQALGPTAMAAVTDVSIDESVERMVRQVIEGFGRIDMLVNCAGVPMTFTPVEELEETEWDRILKVNTKSVYLTVKHAVPHMKRTGGGTIINIASIAGVRARPGLTAYCASKGAVLSLTQALALELAPDGIRVNAINPGPAQTPMLKRFVGEGKTAERDIQKIFVESVPLGFLIEPEDIAEAVLYLAGARKITGEILNVDGGRGI
ncbi:3-oxoacyl-[acyl-carrier protein] reductase [Melghirimyces profundicolus]|uniref:3-oxoacyl-[acyl-carrier protein] reductase n=1 Tax=Melghirimyces profundicolus TaxID=1242148 RepID=A0A2T6C8G6_9BACL|nr:SDR family oxidoreductase [Melghirimyces profundicolus]PTX64611.1 3-oxoacyl-[acyl-carrier protein] reductase [Melghirimyces profundicolus]